ncbi:MAG: hypothetical protein ACREN6_16795 [Gemmatimonadaceae bacterium]
MRPQYTPYAATLLAISLVASVAACGDKSSRQAAGAPAREIQLAPSAPAQPQLNDAPAASSPSGTAASRPEKKAVRVAKAPPRHAPEPEVIVRPLTPQDRPSVAESAPAPTPAPAPVPVEPAPAPAPTSGTVRAGTSFAVHPVARVCTNTFKAGDRFTATLSESVAGSNGAVIPSGSSVVLKVDQSTRSNNSRDSLKLTFSAVSLRIGEQSYDLTGHVSQTTPLEKVRVQTTGDQAKKVGAGALIGALAGQLLGKNTRSTVIGAGVGAAAGAAVAAGTTDYDGCVPATANLMINLDEPLRIKLLPN